MLSNLKISVRLALGFLTMLLILVVISGIAMTSFARINKKVDAITEDKWPKTVILNEIKGNINVVARALRNAIIVADPAEKKKELARIESTFQTVSKSLEQLDKSIASADGKALLQSVNERRAAYRAGLKEIIALVEGKGAYRRMKYESGTHRVQRVPATETQGRVHTSAITVAVLPEAEEVDVKIEAKDIRIDTFCSSGPGGQSVNTTYSAVRITHLPTNTVVSCQDEKSQIKNREKGMRVLRSRLYEIEMDKQNAELAKERKQMVGSGDRSEKIRTYNFPQNRMTDHRIGLTLHQLDLVMEGRLQPIVDALITHYQAEQLKADATQAA